MGGSQDKETRKEIQGETGVEEKETCRVRCTECIGRGGSRSGGSQMLWGSQVSPRLMCEVEEGPDGLSESSVTKVTG